ncbi:hypothetical protein L1887_56845 [Cichorium endivia]|nr:hypothetical protein L1887_56845 [Cichorium endivia]
MSQIACPLCGFGYAATNITNHLCKAHSGAHVSQEAAAAVGLIACPCGQAVLNAAALRKHQGIRKCQGARSQPATSSTPGPPAALTLQSSPSPAAIIVAAASALAPVFSSAAGQQAGRLNPEDVNFQSQRSPTHQPDASSGLVPGGFPEPAQPTYQPDASSDVDPIIFQELDRPEPEQTNENMENGFQADASSGKEPADFPEPEEAGSGTEPESESRQMERRCQICPRKSSHSQHGNPHWMLG